MKNLFLTFIFVLLFGLTSCNNSFDDELKTITPVDTQVVVKPSTYRLHINQNLNIDSIPYYYYLWKKEWRGEYLEDSIRYYKMSYRNTDTLYWRNTNFEVNFDVYIETANIDEAISEMKNIISNGNCIKYAKNYEVKSISPGASIEYIPNDEPFSTPSHNPIDDMRQNPYSPILLAIGTQLNDRQFRTPYDQEILPSDLGGGSQHIWGAKSKKDSTYSYYSKYQKEIVYPTIEISYYYIETYANSFKKIISIGSSNVKCNVTITYDNEKNNYSIDGYTSGGSYDLGSI